MRKPAPPLEPGKHRGGWNPNPPLPDPNFVLAPGGTPFAPSTASGTRHPTPCGDIQAAANAEARQQEVLPLEPGRHRGGWNPHPRMPDPGFVPAPWGTPPLRSCPIAP